MANKSKEETTAATTTETVDTTSAATAEAMSEGTAETASETATAPKQTKTAAAKKKVKIRLPRLEGQNAAQEEFFSVNFKNYIIKRGVEVEVPAEVAEVILNAEKARDAALNYADEHKLREA